MKDFGENLRTLRKRRKLSQDQMADNVGVKRTNWGDYELGKSEPSLETLTRTCGFFGVSFERLCGSNASLIAFLDQQENNNESEPKCEPLCEPNMPKKGSLAVSAKVDTDTQNGQIIKIQADMINTQKMLIDSLSAQITALTERLNDK